MSKRPSPTNSERSNGSSSGRLVRVIKDAEIRSATLTGCVITGDFEIEGATLSGDFEMSNVELIDCTCTRNSIKGGIMKGNGNGTIRGGILSGEYKMTGGSVKGGEYSGGSIRGGSILQSVHN